MTDGDRILIGCICIAGAVLLWRYASLVAQLSGRNMRASDTERRAWFDMIQRAVERRDHPTGETMRLHASERMEQARIGASVDRADVQNDGRPAVHNYTKTGLDGETAYGEPYDRSINE